MDRKLKKYERNYTWSHVYDENVIVHKDGALSLLIEWDGCDIEMLTDQERQNVWLDFYRLIESIGPDYCVEFHLWREHDDTLAKIYLQHGSTAVRGTEFSEIIRQAQAAHLSQYSLANSVGVVLTRVPKKTVFRGAKSVLKQQGVHANWLIENAQTILKYLPGAKIKNAERYLQRIYQSIDRTGFLRKSHIQYDPQLLLSEQLVREAPVVENRALRVNCAVTKVLFVFLYPESMPGWFISISQLSASIHVSHVIRPVDTSSAMRRAERETDLLEGTASRRGRDYTIKGMSDLSAFRRMVADNDLSIFQNAFIIHIHGGISDINLASEKIKDIIERAGGQVRDADYVQLPFFRAGQPGQGYRAPMFRPDHTWQVADMLPVQVFSSGESEPESLRLGSASQLIGFSLSNQTVAHSFTVAMTGAGKGVDKVATIAETYPFGIDWYIAEIGSSYKWVVESFGGTYTQIDPDHTVVNPLPLYQITNADEGYPLDAHIAGSTVRALAFLLTDGQITLDVHSEAVAQNVLQHLYKLPKPEIDAPTLEDFFLEMEKADYLENEKQVLAAKTMTDNLHSFLSTTAGRKFSRPDNLVLSPGITGVDLKEVGKSSPQLLKFYLVFLSLRMANMAFYMTRNPARVLLDEMHEFVRVFPDVVGALISSIARMGRKENAAIDIVTQGIREIDVIEKEVLNSMPLRSLLYRSDEWEEIADRINMPKQPLNIWRGFDYPMSQDYRPSIRSVGKNYFNLFLVYPEILLDLASTTPDALELKEKIGKSITDPLERLDMFRKETNRNVKLAEVANA
ncbi:MAG: hypothetical protein ACE5EH_11800 [Gammaproteobacteria bacterium]